MQNPPPPAPPSWTREATSIRPAAHGRAHPSIPRERLGKESCLPTTTPSPTPRERTGLLDGAHPPRPPRRPEPPLRRRRPRPTVPPTLPKPPPRLATCQPTHRSLPGIFLKCSRLDPDRSGGLHPRNIPPAMLAPKRQAAPRFAPAIPLAVPYRSAPQVPRLIRARRHLKIDSFTPNPSQFHHAPTLKTLAPANPVS
jgi:hypothetical protein